MINFPTVVIPLQSFNTYTKIQMYNFYYNQFKTSNSNCPLRWYQLRKPDDSVPFNYESAQMINGFHNTLAYINVKSDEPMNITFTLRLYSFTNKYANGNKWLTIRVCG